MRRGRRSGARAIVVAAFAVLFGAVMVGEYWLFRRALETLMGLGLAGTALTLYLLESVLVLIFVIALLSFVASGLWMFFRARDTRLLLAAPVPVGSLYALRAVETFILTSWALVIVGVPALLALGSAYRHGVGFYVEGGAVLAAFAVFGGGVGTLLTTLAGAALGRAPTRLTVAALMSLVVLGFVALIGRNVVPSTADFYTVFEPGMLNGKPSSIKFIEAKFGLWPSHPFAAALYVAATGRRAGSPVTRTVLWLAPLVTLAVVATAGRALYARSLPTITEAFALTGRRRAGRRPRPFPRWLRGATGALVERDLLALARDPHEWSRAAFLALLLLVYTAFIIAAPLREVSDRPETVARLLFFTVLAAGYFLTAFALRFVFPAMSLEGRAAWLFFSSPIRPLRLLMARAALYAGALTVAVVPIALAGVLRLVTDPELTLAAVALLLVVAMTTTTSLLALGAAFPDFRETNAESLSASGAGLAGTVICLVYVALVAWLAQRAAQAGASGGSVVPWLAVAAAISGALVTATLTLACRRLNALEAP